MPRGLDFITLVKLITRTKLIHFIAFRLLYKFNSTSIFLLGIFSSLIMTAESRGFWTWVSWVQNLGSTPPGAPFSS